MNTITRATGQLIILVISFCHLAGAQEKERPKTKLYPNIEVAGLYNLNKGDVFPSNNSQNLNTRNSGGFSLGLGLTLFKPKQQGVLFSISAGYKSNNENFVTRSNTNEGDILYKTKVDALYLRPEFSCYFRVVAQNFIGFGLYVEPNICLKETMPQYQLDYNTSTLSAYRTLSSTTYYHWGKNKELNSFLFLPYTSLGISAGYTQIHSGTFIKMVKCRLFFELDPKMVLENNPSPAKMNRSSATIKYYEDDGRSRDVISTDYYVDKMMRLGLSIAIGI